MLIAFVCMKNYNCSHMGYFFQPSGDVALEAMKVFSIRVLIRLNG